ncbi:MAG: hypothetical protein LBU78_15290 [Microbacterium sp.]|jgi:hypothetical protein|nr:hypothetical protein [Microbacterium sp.]
MIDDAQNTRTGPGRALSGIGTAIGYLLVQAAASYVAFMIHIMGALSIAGCGDSCDYALAAASTQAQIWGSVVLLILSATGTAWCAFAGRPSWWVPFVGVGAVALLTIGTGIARDIATPMLDA